MSLDFATRSSQRRLSSSPSIRRAKMAGASALGGLEQSHPGRIGLDGRESAGAEQAPDDGGLGFDPGPPSPECQRRGSARRLLVQTPSFLVRRYFAPTRGMTTYTSAR